MPLLLRARVVVCILVARTSFPGGMLFRIIIRIAAAGSNLEMYGKGLPVYDTYNKL